MKSFGIFLAVIAGIGVLMIGGFILKVLFFPLSTAGTLVQSAYDVKDKTLQADNIIYNYEWFKTAVEDIQATKNKVDIATKAADNFDTAAGVRSTWTFEDKTESARLHAVVQGLQSQLENQVATYNARSKMANRNIFQDGKIPNILEFGAGFLK